MGEVGGELHGPDLTEGVPLDDLREGQPYPGHAEGEGVILVRQGDRVLAVSAACSHYGGPLAEGLVVGDTIRCPWHHARFSLETGEAVGAPALNPVGCWSVELRDGRAYVTGKTETDPLDPRGRSVDGPTSVVIVGAGAAGSAAAEMVRREGYGGPVTLVDPDEAAPYDRPNLSKDYLAGDAPEEWIPLRPGGFYEEHGIERVVAAAESIDPSARSVRLSDGRSLDFGALLLATGATPRRLPVPGGELPHVHVLRSLGDSRSIIAAAEESGEIVIVGASFIGMEAAAALRARGRSVTVVAPEEIPFEVTLGEALGRALLERHRSNGVRFRLGSGVREIREGAVVLEDGSELAADLVVVGIGVRPDTRLAEAAGLDVDDGVLVDRYLESSTPGIFAAGDIARYPDPRGPGRMRIEHWVVAQRQGQAAARNMLGRRAPFVDPPFFWTVQHGLGVGYVGHARAGAAATLDGDIGAGDAAVAFENDGRLSALATVGRDLENLKAEAALERDAKDARGET